MAKIL